MQTIELAPRTARAIVSRKIWNVNTNLYNFQLFFFVIKGLVSSAAYQELDDEQRSKIIYNIYGNAKESADYLVLSKMGKPFDKKEEAKIKKLFPNYPQKHIAEYYTVSHLITNAEGDKDSNGKTISGSVEQNAINTLVSIGYSQQEAERLYKASKG